MEFFCHCFSHILSFLICIFSTVETMSVGLIASIFRTVYGNVPGTNTMAYSQMLVSLLLGSVISLRILIFQSMTEIWMMMGCAVLTIFSYFKAEFLRRQRESEVMQEVDDEMARISAIRERTRQRHREPGEGSGEGPSQGGNQHPWLRQRRRGGRQHRH